MRERDARQLEKLTQYVELSEEYEKKLLKLINDNEEDEENYSADHQKSLKFNLAMVSAVNNCHSIQHIQMRDCVEDKENVFKQIHHIQESIRPMVDSKNTVKNIYGLGKWLGESAKTLVSSCISFAAIYYFLIDRIQ